MRAPLRGPGVTAQDVMAAPEAVAPVPCEQARVIEAFRRPTMTAVGGTRPPLSTQSQSRPRKLR